LTNSDKTYNSVLPSSKAFECSLYSLITASILFLELAIFIVIDLLLWLSFFLLLFPRDSRYREVGIDLPAAGWNVIICLDGKCSLGCGEHAIFSARCHVDWFLNSCTSSLLWNLRTEPKYWSNKRSQRQKHVKFSKHHAMRTYCRVEVLHVLQTSALDEGEVPDSRSCRFTPGMLWIHNRLSPRACLYMNIREIPVPGRNSSPVVKFVASSL
jgi:hypothetical protein